MLCMSWAAKCFAKHDCCCKWYYGKYRRCNVVYRRHCYCCPACLTLSTCDFICSTHGNLVGLGSAVVVLLQLPQYNMCKAGKCLKKPNYCDKNKLCKVCCATVKTLLMWSCACDIGGSHVLALSLMSLWPSFKFITAQMIPVLQTPVHSYKSVPQEASTWLLCSTLAGVLSFLSTCTAGQMKQHLSCSIQCRLVMSARSTGALRNRSSPNPAPSPNPSMARYSGAPTHTAHA